MFKTSLIVVLTVALAAAAFLTRPSERSAKAFLDGGSQPVVDPPKPVAVAVKDAILKAVEPGQSGGLPSGYEFRDRVLWVDVVKDGQTVYTGALAHWVKRDPQPTTAAVPVVAVSASR